MNKRIAFISEHQSPLKSLGGIDGGGQVVYVDNVTKQLASQRYVVDVYTRWEDERLPQIVNCYKGVRVIHVPAGPKDHVRKEDLLQYMPEFTRWMLTFIKKESLTYDLIHANFFMSGQVALDIKKKLGIPFVITFHALGKIRRMHQGNYDEFPKERVRIEEQIVKDANHIIAECPQDREDLIVHYKANQDKISIIPCGFDPNEFFPIDKQLARMSVGLNPKEKIILQLGRMVPRKGVETVIESISLVKKNLDAHIRLLIVGGESEQPDPKKTPEIGRLMKIVKKLGLVDNVTFVGSKNRDKIRYYYNAADVFVSVPWYEPFGITPLEAMACGTPVIGSNVGGIKFSVVHNKTGFLVEPKNPEQLSEKISQILTNESFVKECKTNAIKRMNAFFTWKTVSQSIATLYEKILLSSNVSINQDLWKTDIIDRNIESLIDAARHTQKTLKKPILQASRIINRSFQEGGKIILCGNGGSAMDAQHFAAELTGHFLLNKRKSLPAISLTSDTAALTAIGNDFSFDEIFSRQIESLGKAGDVFIGITTSGNSKNVIKACKKAHEQGIITIGLLGGNEGKILQYCDIALIVPSYNTQIIQEIHTNIIHTLSELTERQLFANDIAQSRQAMTGFKQNKAS